MVSLLYLLSMIALIAFGTGIWKGKEWLLQFSILLLIFISLLALLI